MSTLSERNESYINNLIASYRVLQPLAAHFFPPTLKEALEAHHASPNKTHSAWVICNAFLEVDTVFNKTYFPCLNVFAESELVRAHKMPICREDTATKHDYFDAVANNEAPLYAAQILMDLKTSGQFSEQVMSWFCNIIAKYPHPDQVMPQLLLKLLFKLEQVALLNQTNVDVLFDATERNLSAIYIALSRTKYSDLFVETNAQINFNTIMQNLSDPLGVANGLLELQTAGLLSNGSEELEIRRILTTHPEPQKAATMISCLHRSNSPTDHSGLIAYAKRTMATPHPNQFFQTLKDGPTIATPTSIKEVAQSSTLLASIPVRGVGEFG